MKYLLAMIAVLALSVPAFAQDSETLPDGRKVRIEVKDGAVIIKEGDEADDIEKEIEDILKRVSEEEGVELPEDVQGILKRFREQMEEMRKDMEERMKKIREEFEKSTEDLEKDPDAEVEEYEHTSPDGKTHVKVKIVRIRKTSSSEGETPKAPEAPKKETERKQ